VITATSGRDDGLAAGGLGDKIQSWLKSGDNKGVSPDEIKPTRAG
jgi:uncharacterized protein YidB (DUF937 family)